MLEGVVIRKTENFPSILSNLKMLSAISLSLEEAKICCLANGEGKTCVMQKSYFQYNINLKLAIIKNEYYCTTFSSIHFFSFIELSFLFINRKPLYSPFKWR